MSVVIEALRQYLAHRRDFEAPAGDQPFVTVSRFDGVGSHEVARAIIARLDDLPDKGWNRGWELLDQQLCAWLIKEGRVPATYEELVSEQYGERTLRQMVYEMLVGTAEQENLCRKVGDVMRFLLQTGRTVVVGCAAAAEARALQGPGIRVRVLASEPLRVARVMKEHELSSDAARKLIRTQDETRARLLREHYRREIDDPALYDATFLTDRLPPAEIARAVVELLQARMEARARRAPLSATQVVSLA